MKARQRLYDAQSIYRGADRNRALKPEVRMEKRIIAARTARRGVIVPIIRLRPAETAPMSQPTVSRLTLTRIGSFLADVGSGEMWAYC